MKYSTVEIRPSIQQDWEVSFNELLYDREPGDGNLSGLGFFHYPRKLGKKRAFEKLKSYMITCHIERIQELTASLYKLNELEYPD